VIVMGVAGSGKTTLARALALELGVSYIESDDYHSTSDIEKMAAGVPLDDQDRIPWLDAIGVTLCTANREGNSTVTACSALKRRYRDLLRTFVPDAFFVELDGDPDLIFARMAARRHHFMPPELLTSQFAALEPLEVDERGIRIDVALSSHEITEIATMAISA
jgi:gluconokinase